MSRTRFTINLYEDVPLEAEIVQRLKGLDRNRRNEIIREIVRRGYEIVFPAHAAERLPAASVASPPIVPREDAPRTDVDETAVKAQPEGRKAPEAPAKKRAEAKAPADAREATPEPATPSPAASPEPPPEPQQAATIPPQGDVAPNPPAKTPEPEGMVDPLAMFKLG